MSKNVELFNDLDVLDKVKPVVFIPGLGGMTSSMAATYFEVSFNAITYIIRTHLDVLQDEGLRYISSNALKRELRKLDAVIEKHNQCVTLEIDGKVFETALRGQYILNRKNLVRLALYMKHSYVAENIKRAILGDYVQEADDKTYSELDLDKLPDFNDIDLLPCVNGATFAMIADCFNVPVDILKKLYSDNRVDLTVAGAMTLARLDIQRIFESSGVNVYMSDDELCTDLNGKQIVIERTCVIFTRNAIERLYSLLIAECKMIQGVSDGNSTVEEYDVDMQNIVSDDNQKSTLGEIADIPAEEPEHESTLQSEKVQQTSELTDEFYAIIGKAYIENDELLLSQLCNAALAAQKEEITKLENDNMKLTDIHAQMTALIADYHQCDKISDRISA